MNNTVSHREVWRLAWPMIISGLTVPLVGMVDTAVVGRLPGPEYLGGVALGALVFSYVFFGFGFLRMGTTGLAAQAFGAGDRRALSLLFVRASVLALGLSLLLYVLHIPLRTLAFEWLQGSERVESMGIAYFDIRLFGIPAVFMRMVLVGWFLGVQDSRSPLYILLLTNALNIALDVLFVWHWGWQVEGVAWATVIAEYVGVALGLCLWFRSAARDSVLDKLKGCINWAAYRPMFQVNGNIFVRTLMLISCLAFFTAQGAKQSETVLAANALLMNFMMFLAFGMDGLAHAAEALVGKCVGAADKKRLLQAIRITALWSLLCAFVFSAAYAVLGEWLVALLTNLDNVRTTASEYLPWLVLMPLVACWGFCLDGIFIGGTWSRDMRNMMALSCAVYLVVWWLAQPLGNHGLWLALIVWFAARGVTLAWVLPKRLADIRLL